MIVIAHNIRSLHNVGAIFRSADAFGVSKVYLTGFTGQPPRKEIAKVSLGSENRVPWEYREDIITLIHDLQGEGKRVLALETGKGSAPISSVPPGDDVLILGNEVEGMEEEVISASDMKVEIPMPGQKRSLNVSVSAGIAIFALTQK